MLGVKSVSVGRFNRPVETEPIGSGRTGSRPIPTGGMGGRILVRGSLVWPRNSVFWGSAQRNLARLKKVGHNPK